MPITRNAGSVNQKCGAGPVFLVNIQPFCFCLFGPFIAARTFFSMGKSCGVKPERSGGGGALSEEVNVLLSAHCSLVSLIWSGRGNTVKDIYLLLNLAEYFIPIYFA